MSALRGLELTLALSVAWITFVLSLRYRVYRDLLRYDPATDQGYEFGKSDAIVAGVDLRATEFAWPSGLAGCDSAFLEVTVLPTVRGRFYDPYITVSNGAHSIRQYLERGASGRRHVNVSELAGKLQPGAVLLLGCTGVRIRPQKGHLFGFKNQLPTLARVLVVAPHPDDAEIAAFGLYARSTSCVVTLTTGEQGGFLTKLLYDSSRKANLTAEVRVWDSISVPRIGGVSPEHALNLCYPDGALAELFARQQTPASSTLLSDEKRSALRKMNLSPFILDLTAPLTWQTLVADLRMLFETFKPDLIVCPHPLLDSHSDHAFATLATCEALAEANFPAGRLLLHVTHSPWTPAHPIGETDGVVSLPPHFGTAAFFRSICSLPLAPEERLRKHLALEAMHDLRTIPLTNAPSWRTAFRTFLSETRARLGGIRRDSTSFYRRTIRPNELFFVVPFSEGSALRQAYLDRKDFAKE